MQNHQFSPFENQDVVLNLLSGRGRSLRYTNRRGQSTSSGSRVSTSMGEKEQYKNRIDLLQGTLDMLILQTLQWGPQHGYGIVQALRLRSGDVLQVETGSLYPALHRLERQSWVQSEWKQSESKQKARYYRITAKGKKQLASGSGPMGADCRSDWVGDVRQAGGERVMKWFPSFGFQRRKRELQEEIDAHLQMAIADRVARGETAETARQAAAREFGNIPLVQDVTRDMWGQASLEQLGRDVRYALRQLRKSPGFSITATAMLAVAICANSTVFSWIDGTMLRPIPGRAGHGRSCEPAERRTELFPRLRPSP